MFFFAGASAGNLSSGHSPFTFVQASFRSDHVTFRAESWQLPIANTWFVAETVHIMHPQRATVNVLMSLRFKFVSILEPGRRKSCLFAAFWRLPFMYR